MASDGRIIWQLAHLDAGQDPVLNAIVSQKVAHVSVEFLLTNGIKPHVVYNLKPAALPPPPADNYRGVRLSMEWHARDDFDTGDFEIRPLLSLISSKKAVGAFDFPLRNKNLTVRDWCQIFRGRRQGLPAGHTSDLTRFRFVVSPIGKMDGCRDFICQSFIRLYELGVIEGHGGGIGVDPSWENFGILERHPELGTRDDFWFFDIIDKNFIKVDEGTNYERIRIIAEPMHRGVFATHRRTEVFRVGQHSFRLNYVNEGPGSGPGDGPGGPPRSGGGGGGNGGGSGGGPSGPSRTGGGGGGGGSGDAVRRPPQGGHGGAGPTGPTRGATGHQRGTGSDRNSGPTDAGAGPGTGRQTSVKQTSRDTTAHTTGQTTRHTSVHTSEPLVSRPKPKSKSTTTTDPPPNATERKKPTTASKHAPVKSTTTSTDARVKATTASTDARAKHTVSGTQVKKTKKAT